MVGTPLGGTRCRLWQLPCSTVWAHALSTGTPGAWPPSPRCLRTPGKATGSEPHPRGESLLQTPVSGSGSGREPLQGQVTAETSSAPRSGRAGPPRTSGAGPLSQRAAEAGPLPQCVVLLSLSLMWLALLGLDLLKTIPSFLLSYLSLLEWECLYVPPLCFRDTTCLGPWVHSWREVCLRINQAYSLTCT